MLQREQFEAKKQKKKDFSEKEEPCFAKKHSKQDLS